MKNTRKRTWGTVVSKNSRTTHGFQVAVQTDPEFKTVKTWCQIDVKSYGPGAEFVMLRSSINCTNCLRTMGWPV